MSNIVQADFRFKRAKQLVKRQWVSCGQPITVEKGVVVGFVFNGLTDALPYQAVFLHNGIPVTVELDKRAGGVVIGDYVYRRVAVCWDKDQLYKQILIEVSEADQAAMPVNPNKGCSND